MSSRRPSPVGWGAVVVGASALLVVLGALTAWVQVPSGEGVARLAGTDLLAGPTPAVSGVLTAVLASVATLLALFLAHRGSAAIATAVAGLAIELVAIAVVLAPATAVGPRVGQQALALGHVGTGLVLTLAGGLGVLLGGVVAYRRHR